MKYPYLLFFLGGGLVSAQGVAAVEPVVAAKQADAAQASIAESTLALQQLYEALSGLKTDADIKAALPQLEKAVAAYDAAMGVLPQEVRLQDMDVTDWRAAHRRLRTLCTGDAFTELVWMNDALKYYLLLRSAYLPCYLHEETAEYILMTSSMPELAPDPAMQPYCDKVRAAAAEKHAAFMKEHADEYAGGNGADEASAIILRPLVELPQGQEDDAAERRLVSAYMRAVYPQFSAGYSSVEATPDGYLYIIMTQYPGVYENAKGKLKLITYFVYFCTKSPRKQE